MLWQMMEVRAVLFLLLLISGKWLRRRCVAIAGCDVVCILYFLVTISVCSASLRRSGLAAVGVEGGAGLLLCYHVLRWLVARLFCSNEAREYHDNCEFSTCFVKNF